MTGIDSNYVSGIPLNTIMDIGPLNPFIVKEFHNFCYGITDMPHAPYRVVFILVIEPSSEQIWLPFGMYFMSAVP